MSRLTTLSRALSEIKTGLSVPMNYGNHGQIVSALRFIREFRQLRALILKGPMPPQIVISLAGGRIGNLLTDLSIVKGLLELLGFKDSYPMTASGFEINESNNRSRLKAAGFSEIEIGRDLQLHRQNFEEIVHSWSAHQSVNWSEASVDTAGKLWLGSKGVGFGSDVLLGVKNESALRFICDRLGSAPRVSFASNLNDAALRQKVLERVPGCKKIFVGQFRNNQTKDPLGSLRNASLTAWRKVITNLLDREQDAVLVVLYQTGGSRDSPPQEILEHDSGRVLSAIDIVGNSVTQQLQLIEIADLFLGSPSGPSFWAFLKDVPAVFSSYASVLSYRSGYQGFIQNGFWTVMPGRRHRLVMDDDPEKILRAIDQVQVAEGRRSH